MAGSSVFEELFRAMEKNPAPRWIFGEPVTLGGHQVVPVSEFHLVVELPAPVSAGEGASPPAASALRMEGRPVGFLGEQEGRVVFVPIQPDAGRQEAPRDDTPPWVDDLFVKLDDVRDSLQKGARDDDEGCRRDRPRRDEDGRERRPRRDRDERD